MKRNYAALMFVFLCFVFCAAQANAQSHQKFMEMYQKAQEAKDPQKNKKPASIWDDTSEANPYFKNRTNKTGADVREQMKKREPKKTTFKRRVYTGPSKEEIRAAASQKAVENFRASLPKGSYDVRYDKIGYDLDGDRLTISNLTFVPKAGTAEAKKIPYYMKAEDIALRGYNIGEKENTPLVKTGEAAIRGLEVPIWNENGVKSGQMQFAQLKMNGDFLEYMKNGKGKFDAVELSDFRSEAIIRETILNNIVRSKVFSASSALFNEVDIASSMTESLKNQTLDGMSFKSALINSQQIDSQAGAMAAMISYSARILNEDMVVAARTEAQKKKPNMTIEQLKENIEEKKRALAELNEESDVGV